jgi:hypothetical protein
VRPDYASASDAGRERIAVQRYEYLPATQANLAVLK